MQAGLEHSEPGGVKPWQLSDPPTDLQEKAWKVQASRQTSAPSHGVPWMAAHDLCHYSVKTAPFKGEIFRSKLHLRLASRRCNFTSELRLCNLVCFIIFLCACLYRCRCCKYPPSCGKPHHRARIAPTPTLPQPRPALPHPALPIPPHSHPAPTTSPPNPPNRLGSPPPPLKF